MFKLIKTTVTALTISLVLIFGVVQLTQAGMWDSVATSAWDKADSNHYVLEVYGYAARVYEWVPLDNPDVRCVFVASNKSSGVACYPVK